MGTVLVALAVAVTACTDDLDTPSPQQMEVLSPAEPFGSGSMAPHVAVAGDGAVLATWLEPADDGHVLKHARLEANGAWRAPVEVARGADWFVNWADFPSSAVATPTGRIVTFFLQQSADKSYAYDVRLTWSDNDGATWSEPVTPHRDGTATEHGFVSLIPLDGGRMGLTWLDGRKFADAEAGADGHGEGSQAEMTLRYAELTTEGELVEEAELDGRTCDCCQTSGVAVPGGLAIFYRDRSPDEIRDISVVRRIDGRWENPKPVAEDNWLIAGCPVNGPAAASRDDNVAVGWFTAAEGRLRVNLSFSRDGAATFDPPILISDQSPLGRVDLQWLGEDALVSWMEQRGDSALVTLRTVAPDGRQSADLVVGTTTAERRSGFPRLVIREDGSAVVAWTVIADDGTRIRMRTIDRLPLMDNL